MVNVALVQSAGRYIVLTVGFPMLLLGAVGNALVIWLFTRRIGRFRKSPCIHYFVSMGVVKTIHLVHVMVYFIMSVGFGVDPTLTSPVYCKLRNYFGQATMPHIMFTLHCAATISQYLATSRQASYRKKNTHKGTCICVLLIILFWCTQAVPFLVLYKIKIMPQTNKPICDSFNTALQHYTTWFLRILAVIILPFTILPLFGYLTLRNIRQLGNSANRQQQIERQMSLMLLVQIIYYLISCVPFNIWTVYLSVAAKITKSSERQAIENLVNTITLLLISSNFADSFYLFYATSKTFRKQFKAACQATFGRLRGFEHAQIRPTTASVIQTGV